MLICNLIEERYKLLRKIQFGMPYCADTYWSMLNQQYGLYLGCSPVILCYVADTCETPVTTTCDISITSSTLDTPICDTLTITIL